MPYLNGDRLVDGGGNPIIDGINNYLQTPLFDFSGLVTWLRTIYDSVVGVGQGDFFAGIARYAASILTGNPEWLTLGYTDPIVTASFLNTNTIAGWLAPSDPNPANLRTQLLTAIQAVRTDAASPHLATIQDVLDVVGVGPGVELPTTPPVTWPTAPTVEQIWGYVLGSLYSPSRSADAALGAIWNYVNTLNLYGGERLKHTPHFTVDHLATAGPSWATAFAGVLPDYADIQLDDTVLSWLTRTVPDRTWEADSTTGLICTYTNLTGEYHTRIDCTLTDSDLQAIRAGYGNAATSVLNVPPVWPGVENAILGETLPCTTSLVFTGACDGVIISIAATGWIPGYMGIGTYKLYRGAGRIAFVSDNGQMEEWQSVPGDECVLTPRHLQHAAGFVLAFYHDVTAAVTPWTLPA